MENLRFQAGKMVYFGLVMLSLPCIVQEGDVVSDADLNNVVSKWIQEASTPVRQPSPSAEGAISGWRVDAPPCDEVMRRAARTGTAEDVLQQEINRVLNCTLHSPEAALRVYLHWYYYFDPLHNKAFRGSKDSLDELFAKAQVQLWLEHPEELERMAWFVAWANGPSKEWLGMRLGTFASWLDPETPVFATTVTLKSGEVISYEPSPPGVWCQRRLLMFLACVTDCPEVYNNKKASEILGGYKAWHTKVSDAFRSGEISASGFSPSWSIRHGRAEARPKKYIPTLRFVPQRPFPGWGDSPLPMTPLEFRRHI